MSYRRNCGSRATGLSPPPPAHLSPSTAAHTENNMDSKLVASMKESNEEARELLIAISDASPEKMILGSTESKKNADEFAVLKLKNDGDDDKFRSELISISYAESPDVKV
ncbi:hypothetical protein L6164_021208 [Bauhinia variegata]|uniref:Uncharacterized protein n=1 Tax=Bauhinia variegata TaxID=167791 RepID=A0ACB9MXH4_BAUVA|nr:hypothetical protein L6164_021208 [Bauhinia variegata]